MRPGEDLRKHVEHEDNYAIMSVKKPTSGNWNHAFAVNKTASGTLMANGNSCLFPVFTYDNLHRSENLSNEARLYMYRLYGTDVGAKDTMGYVYAILHSGFYKSKYEKPLSVGINFPRIPFVSDYKTFQILSSIGNNLIQTHISRKGDNDNVNFKGNGGFVIGNVCWKSDNLYINDKSYISNISKEIYNYKIGGNQVLKTFLKNRKGYDFEDEAHVIKSIVSTIKKTCNLVDRINEVFNSDTKLDDSFYTAGTL